jgi:hypothetical protein
MDTLMTYLMGFGLASGAGGRACIPVFALGLFHHTEYFELSPDFAWIASIPVLCVLGVLTLIEILADLHPEISELNEFVSWIPKLVGGFIAFAAATGEVDSNLIQLGASGLFGAITSGSIHYLRGKVRGVTRDIADVSHESVDQAASIGETGLVATVAATAVMLPILVPVVLLLGFTLGYGFKRYLDGRRVSCVHEACGKPIRPGAMICEHCHQPQQEP